MTERKLKIAISIWCFKPETGGLQAYAEQLCWELQRRGHDVVVVTRAATRVPQRRDYLFFNERAGNLSVKNIRVRPLRFARTWRPVLWLLGKLVVRPPFQTIAVQLYKLVSRKAARLAFCDVDLIHHVGEASPLNGFAAAAAARQWNIPFVVSPTCHPHHVGDSPLDLRLYRQANRLLVYTHYEAQYMREKLIDCTIDVVGIGIEDRSDGNAEQFRTRFGLTGPFILFIGRKDPQKGYPLLIDAFKIVRRQRPEFSLVCMGPAGSVTPAKNVEGVVELDFTSDKVKHDALAGCTCLCVPSEGESFGLVFMEAGRYGKPVVGRNVPVLQELLGAGEGGLLLGQRDRTRNEAALKPEELAGALLGLITNPQECRRLGENCRLVSEEFLWRHKIEGYEKSYEQTLDQFKHGERNDQPILEGTP
jgi:glycosyltransferase involved in cell wall biosynthesis